MKAIIAAGGKGTRLRPLTYSTNKQLLPIANKPLLMYPLETIIKAGIKQVGIVSQDKTAIEELLGDGKKLGIKITYIHQPEPLGVAHVVKVSEKFINGDDFVYLLGDNIFTAGLKKPLDHFKKSKADAVLIIVEHEENYRLGVPYFDQNNKLIKVVEKPAKPPNNFGVPGMYMFSSKVFQAFKDKKDGIKPSARGELEIVELYNYMLKKDYKVEAVQIDGHWRDPGKFDDTLETNKLILDLTIPKNTRKIKGKIDENSKITNGIILGKNSKVINSRIIGPVIIGDNVEIRDSYIGHYTSIADECEIVNSKVQYSILLEDVHITDVEKKIEASMIGKHTEVTTTKRKPPIYNFMVADHCRLNLPF
ncbi:glucose-1-phosphate thymidylyltransferase [Patescibacteria group bacterium]